MATRTRVDPIDRDVALLIAQDLSPAARSQQFADLAKGFIDEADESNRQVLGRVPPRRVFVDGSEGKPLTSVSPSGVIVAEWELVGDVLVFIANSLVDLSPVGRASQGDKHPGLYRASHSVFADGQEISLGGDIPVANEYVFMNMLDYARVVEQGKAGRDGVHVYEKTAKAAKSRFGNVAKIGMTYRGLAGAGRLGVQAGAVTAKVGESFAVRSANGRFAKGNRNMARVGGRQAHNVSSSRFPAISVRLG